MSESTCDTRLAHRPEYEDYDFGAQHPLRPARIRAGLDLISALGMAPSPRQQLQPPPATREELHQIIHETGRHLFPGTGFIHELGEGLGRGYNLNLPVEPFTDDRSWLDSLELLLPPV